MRRARQVSRALRPALLAGALVLGALGGTACHRPIERMYYSRDYFDVSAEAIPSPVAPLAREVRWTYAVTAPAGTTVFDDGRPDRPAAGPGPMSPRSRAQQAVLQPSMDALHARVKSKQRVPNGNVEGVIRFQVDQLIRTSLVDTGFVGPRAPAGSVLLLELVSVDARARTHRGQDGVIAAKVVLLRDGESTAAWRGFEGKGYFKAPDIGPAGFVDASTLTAPPGSEGVSLWIHAALVRSAVAELAAH